MYKVDSKNKTLVKLDKVKYSDIGFRERFDIQEWVEKNPCVLGEDLLIIAKEYELPSRSRLDLLAIDKSANIVVVELKRDDSGVNVDWQSIKYASYCSAFTNEEIYEIFSCYLGTDINCAEDKIQEFIEVELENLNQKQRIILASRDFHSDAVSAVLWLLDYGIEIQCVKLEPFIEYSSGENNIFINPNIIIPAPEARDYIKRKEMKSKEKSFARSGIFSFEKSNYDEKRLEVELLKTFKRDSDLTPRIISFFEILLSEDKIFKRDEIKQELHNRKIGNDIGHTGRFLSNISQFLTKKSNPHLRQVVDFESDGESGQMKDNYCIVNQYRDLVREIIEKIKNERNV